MSCWVTKLRFIATPCLVAIALLLGPSSAAANMKATEAADNDEEIELLEDCDQPDYVSKMHKILDGKLTSTQRRSKDWTLTSFIINSDGSLQDTRLCNSTGNKDFNAKTLKILRSAKLPRLPEDCPDKVKATHAFNYRAAWKNTHVAEDSVESTKSKSETKASASEEIFQGPFKVILKRAKESGASPKELANLEAVLNIIINCTEIVVIVMFFSIFYGGSLIFSFFAAATVWCLHRVLLGRFPS